MQLLRGCFMSFSFRNLDEKQKNEIYKTIEETKEATELLTFFPTETYDIYYPKKSQHYYIVRKEVYAKGGAPGTNIRLAVRVNRVNSELKFSPIDMVLKETQVDLKSPEEKTKSAKEARRLKKWYPETEYLEVVKSGNGSEFSCIFMPFFRGNLLFKNQDLESKTLELNYDVASLEIEAIHYLCFQIALKLHKLHTPFSEYQASYHGDISANNIFFTEKNISQFGFYFTYPDIDFFDVGSGDEVKDLYEFQQVEFSATPGFIPPEVFNNQKGIPSDYYALSSILSILYGAKNPFIDKFKKVKEHTNKINAKKEADKSFLYVAKNLAEVKWDELKCPAVVLYKEEDSKNNVYQAIFVNNRKLEYATHFIVADEKPVLAKASTFYMCLNPKKSILYYDHKSEEKFIKEEDEKILLDRFRDISNDELKTNPPQCRSDLINILKREAFDIPLTINMDFSKIYDDHAVIHDLLALKEDAIKEVSKSNNLSAVLIEKILYQAIYAKMNSEPSRPLPSSRKEECKVMYNLEGFFEGEKYKKWLWARSYLKNYIERLQAVNPWDRPTPLENILFF